MVIYKNPCGHKKSKKYRCTIFFEYMLFIKKFIKYFILFFFYLCQDGPSCDGIIKTHSTPDLRGRIINLTEIDNSELIIRGEFYLSRYRFEYRDRFLEGGYKTYNDKTFTAPILENGDFHLKPRKLYTIHQARLRGDIELTIKDPETLKKNGQYDFLGSTSREIDTLGDLSRKDYYLEQNSYKLYVSDGFVEKIRAMIPSVLKSPYDSTIELRHLVAPVSEKIPYTFSEGAVYFDEHDAFSETLYSVLTYRLEKNSPHALSFTSLVLLPANQPKVAEHIYLILDMKNTMGGESSYIVWNRFVERQVDQSALLDSVFLDEKVLRQINSNILMHEKRVQLARAINEENVQKCERLFSIGVSPNSRDDSGYPFLLRAAQKGDIAMIKSFLTHGADPNLKNPYGDTFMDWLDEDTKEAISYLLQGKK